MYIEEKNRQYEWAVRVIITITLGGGGGKGINLTNISNRDRKPLGETKTDLFRNYSCFPKVEYNEKFILLNFEKTNFKVTLRSTGFTVEAIHTNVNIPWAICTIISMKQILSAFVVQRRNF